MLDPLSSYLPLSRSPKHDPGPADYVQDGSELIVLTQILVENIRCNQAYFWAMIAQRSRLPFSVPLPGNAVQAIGSRLPPEQAAIVETQVEQWLNEHPYIHREWDLIEMPIGKPDVAAKLREISP